MRILGLADRERIDVVAARGEHAGNVGKYPGHVLNQGGKNVSVVGVGHQRVLGKWKKRDLEWEIEAKHDNFGAKIQQGPRFTPLLILP